MKKVTIRQVKQGEFFKLRESEKAPVWVRGEYNRYSKKFECYKYDNVNYWQEFKGDREVFTGFTF